MISFLQMIEEAAQLSYIALASVILAFERKTNTLTVTEKVKGVQQKNHKGLFILAGIVAALILTSLVLLPALMPRVGPRGPPPPGSGGPPQQSLQGAPAQTPSGQGPP